MSGLQDKRTSTSAVPIAAGAAWVLIRLLLLLLCYCIIHPGQQASSSLLRSALGRLLFILPPSTSHRRHTFIPLPWILHLEDSLAEPPPTTHTSVHIYTIAIQGVVSEGAGHGIPQSTHFSTSAITATIAATATSTAASRLGKVRLILSVAAWLPGC
ncbi:hypothetical protein K431DRAFT_85022 [Polychaeton citri CBS 116435]|uniref:Uncharacterized protein n=1 Tax=Polychaeton citri CBS 116435 TaxID=1314669 RepID=A0A9P4UPW8_9PEZI|nr:hypothetical protein K431DRAFT_85022 [Polychaeton citri CBS 116435]